MKPSRIIMLFELIKCTKLFAMETNYFPLLFIYQGSLGCIDFNYFSQTGGNGNESTPPPPSPPLTPPTAQSYQYSCDAFLLKKYFLFQLIMRRSRPASKGMRNWETQDAETRYILLCCIMRGCICIICSYVCMYACGVSELQRLVQFWMCLECLCNDFGTDMSVANFTIECDQYILYIFHKLLINNCIYYNYLHLMICNKYMNMDYGN